MWGNMQSVFSYEEPQMHSVESNTHLSRTLYQHFVLEYAGSDLPGSASFPAFRRVPPEFSDLGTTGRPSGFPVCHRG